MLARLCRHLAMTDGRLAHRFPAALLDAVEAAVRDTEKRHGGEIRVALESALPPLAILRGQSARERAVEVFSALRVWDTEHNNGVLLYVLGADQAIEIVADRGYNGRIDAAAWQRVCDTMRTKLRAGDYAGGLLGGIAEASALIAPHFPVPAASALSDRPIVL